MGHHAVVPEAKLHTFFQSALRLFGGGESVVGGRALQTDGKRRAQAFGGHARAAQAHFLLCGEGGGYVRGQCLARQCAQCFEDGRTPKAAVKRLAQHHAGGLVVGEGCVRRDGQARLEAQCRRFLPAAHARV